jgi:antitoxin component YwqK of YwqJK toxin-antitoxin module
MIKHILVFQILFAVTNISYSQDTVSVDNIVMMSEDTFFFPVNKKDGNKFSGVIVFDESESIIIYSTYKEGVLINTTTKESLKFNPTSKSTGGDTNLFENRSYFEKDKDGKLIVEGRYENDKKNGLWAYYKDAVKIETGNYRDGYRTGLWEFYSDKGTLTRVRFFKGGTAVFERGVKSRKGHKFSGIINFIENDTITKSYSYKEDVLIWIKIKNREILIVEQEFKGLAVKSGKYIERDINGGLLIQGEYLDGYKNGLWSYYKNGVRVELGSYYFKGLKSGIWKFFSNEGKLDRIDFYKNGKVEKNEYYENGKQITKP